MVEGRGALGGLRRSLALTKGHRASLFAAYLVLALLALVLWTVATLLALPSPNLPVVALARAVALGIAATWFTMAAAVAYDLLTRSGPAVPPPSPPPPRPL